MSSPTQTPPWPNCGDQGSPRSSCGCGFWEVGPTPDARIAPATSVDEARAYAAAHYGLPPDCRAAVLYEPVGGFHQRDPVLDQLSESLDSH